MAINIAPMQTRIVPSKENLVNASPRITVAKMVLKTRPDYYATVCQQRKRRDGNHCDTNGLKGRENRERKGGDLDRTPDDVRYNEHQHAQL